MASSSKAADPLALLHQALSQPDGSAEQGQALVALAAALQAAPSFVPTLWGALLDQLARNPNKANLRRWVVISLMEGTLCGQQHAPEVKAQLAVQSIDAFERTIADPDPKIRRAVYSCFASSYAHIFKHVCRDPDERLWARVTALKNRIVPEFSNGTLSARLAATKVAQRIIQTQTRASADPRVAAKATDPSLALVASHHPFLRADVLEAEANKLIEQAVGVLFVAKQADAVCAVVNMLALLVRPRPSLAPVIVGSLVNWSPASNLSEASPMEVKSVEKAVRIALANLDRNGGPAVASLHNQINDYLHRQSGRMQMAAEAAMRAREQAATLKRSRIADELTQSAAQTTKRRKTSKKAREDKKAAAATTGGSVFSRAMAGQVDPNDPASFDVKTIPLAVVVELIINNLQVVADSALATAIASERAHLSAAAAASGPINPLEMDAEESSEDEQEIESEEDEDEAGDASILLEDFQLPPPEPLGPEKKATFVSSALLRLCAPPDDAGIGPLWVIMLVRMATRGAPTTAAADVARQNLFDYIAADPAIRLGVARSWLLEEWNGSGREAYTLWLDRLFDKLGSKSPGPHGTPDHVMLSQFVLDLPEVSRALCERLKRMCTEVDTLQPGFVALRELTAFRPPVRRDALDMILALATHPERVTRNAAILTLKRFTSDIPVLAEPVVRFAIELVRRAEVAPPEPAPAAAPAAAAEDKPAAVEGGGDDVEMAEAADVAEEASADAKPAVAEVTFANVVDEKIVDGLPPPSNEIEVTQHIELLLALSSKSTDLLDELFASYARMPASTQEHVRTTVTPLIRSLGPSHPKLLDLLRSHPPGSDTLAYTCLALMTDKGKSPSAPLVELVKTMLAQGDVPPQYLVVVISELDKGEMVKMLPRVIALLGNKPPERGLVQNVFENVVNSAAFGRETSANVPPPDRPTASITPVELLAILHSADKTVGLKPAIEAIALCFSMTDIFRHDVWAAYMSQALDEPVLPTLFLRTVLQAVSAHKTLVPFVSTTLLSRLVTKKVWATPQLWEGFIRCARQTAPGSYASLVQLPKDQLRDVVTKQPALRAGLRDYVTKKMASNQARQHALLETIAEPAQSTAA